MDRRREGGRERGREGERKEGRKWEGKGGREGEREGGYLLDLENEGGTRNSAWSDQPRTYLAGSFHKQWPQTSHPNS